MKTITLVCGLLLGLSFSTPLFSQKVIALHHAGVVSYFTDLNAAYTAAADGDTLYLPGGSFDGFTLQKSLTIIGVGHHPDSTAATGPTIIASLILYTGSDNSFISGINFNNVFQVIEPVSNVTISRCYLNKGISFSAPCSNWTILENLLQTASIGYYQNSIQTANNATYISNSFIANNVMLQGIGGISASMITNNIFLANVIAGHSNTIKNNIMGVGNNTLGNTSNSQFFNNLNTGVNGGPSGSGNTGSGNYLDNVELSSVFVNYSPTNTFYQNDFHVVNPAYLGDDNTPAGIYGGSFPWKDGSLPFTPHIRSKTIGATTNPDGTLKINIKVKAQSN